MTSGSSNALVLMNANFNAELVLKDVWVQYELLVKDACWPRPSDNSSLSSYANFDGFNLA
jgi:hypothetical protein